MRLLTACGPAQQASQEVRPPVPEPLQVHPLREESYFTELVRYIHLNPLRAGIVATTEDLEERFRFCGHGPILGRCANSWQDVHGVLGLFADETSLARTAYLRFVKEGATAGRRDDLVGGGLIRSSGGWTNVLTCAVRIFFRKSNERILGDEVRGRGAL